VYIQEAHPTDGWQVPDNVRQNVLVARPRTLDERSHVAQTCMANLSLRLPAVVDTLDNATDNAYKAWPDRFYLIDADGDVVYKSGPGPFGFHAGEVERVLEIVTRAAHG